MTAVDPQTALGRVHISSKAQPAPSTRLLCSQRVRLAGRGQLPVNGVVAVSDDVPVEEVKPDGVLQDIMIQQLEYEGLGG